MKRCKMDVCGKIIWPWQKERDGCHDSCKRLDETFKSTIKKMEKDNPLLAKLRKQNADFKKMFPNNCYIIIQFNAYDLP